MRALKSANPNVSFPADSFSRNDIKVDYGIVDVASTSRPDTKGHFVVEGTPELVSGVWTQVWVKTLKQPEQVEGWEITSVDEPFESGKIAEQGLPFWDGSEWKMTWTLRDATWLEARVQEYGSLDKQVEYITENGLDAWQTKVAGIKAAFPKTS